MGIAEACRTAATWPENLTVAVNLSPAQFSAGSISDIVAAALKESGLAAHRLELEITETLLLGNSEAIMAELQTLKAMGVAIVMDDFGTGYSSLSYLWRFPFDKIKIDRSFMQGFDGSGRDAKTVVKTIIALGRELNMRVTVEGVETATQAAFLDKASTAIRSRVLLRPAGPRHRRRRLYHRGISLSGKRWGNRPGSLWIAEDLRCCASG
jgi:EAL domain-containing protein (putative c-di-GMP-specific phosphodiesterase class I)